MFYFLKVKKKMSNDPSVKLLQFLAHLFANIYQCQYQYNGNTEKKHFDDKNAVTCDYLLVITVNTIKNNTYDVDVIYAMKE